MSSHERQQAEARRVQHLHGQSLTGKQLPVPLSEEKGAGARPILRRGETYFKPKWDLVKTPFGDVVASDENTIALVTQCRTPRTGLVIETDKEVVRNGVFVTRPEWGRFEWWEKRGVMYASRLSFDNPDVDKNMTAYFPVHTNGEAFFVRQLDGLFGMLGEKWGRVLSTSMTVKDIASLEERTSRRATLWNEIVDAGDVKVRPHNDLLPLVPRVPAGEMMRLAGGEDQASVNSSM